MSATMKIPGIGTVKTTYVYIGVGITAAIVLFAYYRRSQAGASAPAAAVDAQAVDPYSTDSTAAGYNTVYPSGYSSTGYDLYGNPLPPSTGLGSGGAYTTNNDWATAAQDALAGAGIARETSGLAIGHVLGGLTVTTTQQGYFLQAVGLLGQPPQGYPKPIKIVDAPAPPSSAGSATPGKPSGVKAKSVGKTVVTLDWNPVSGADGYAVYRDGHKIVTVVYSTAQMSNLRANHTYSFGVATLKGGKLSGQTTIHVKTHK